MPTQWAWGGGALILLMTLILLRKPLGWLLRLLGRMAVGLAGLFALGQVSGAIGVTLGVNLWNALVVALLGVPGVGLLLMLNWVLQV